MKSEHDKNLWLFFKTLEQERIITHLQEGLGRTIACYSGDCVQFGLPEIGTPSPTFDAIAGGVLRFESPILAFEIVCMLNDKLFHEMFSELFSRNSVDRDSDSENLVKELLNITLGVFNSRLQQSGPAGRYSFPIAFSGLALETFLQACPKKAVLFSFGHGADQSSLGIYPEGSLNLPWHFDQNSQN